MYALSIQRQLFTALFSLSKSDMSFKTCMPYQHRDGCLQYSMPYGFLYTVYQYAYSLFCDTEY